LIQPRCPSRRQAPITSAQEDGRELCILGPVRDDEIDVVVAIEVPSRHRGRAVADTAARWIGDAPVQDPYVALELVRHSQVGTPIRIEEGGHDRNGPLDRRDVGPVGRSRRRPRLAVRRSSRNEEIAASLIITVATAKTHVSRALRKVDARDRAQLVALAYETGLVHPRTQGMHPAPRVTLAPTLTAVA
jgi:hypothetical protein